MRIAFLDAVSGISGDMLLAAAVSAGADLAPVNLALGRLGIAGEVESETVIRGGVQAVRLWLRRPGEERQLLGAAPGFTPAPHEPPHPHPPRPKAGGAAVPPPPAHRSLGEILHRLDAAGLAPAVAARARAVFLALGQAEARVHGHPEGADLAALALHEAGQDDALLDVAGAAMALEQLGIERLQCSPLNTGSGLVTCAHGRFPVPAPATLELLRGLPVYSDGTEAELVTPTGAALARTLAQGFGPMPPMRPEAVGYGAGSYELPGRPDLLRLVIGRMAEAPVRLAEAGREAAGAEAGGDEVAVLEANVDDMNPQFYGYLAERALETGALDIFSCPVQMKKNRPGLLITILARPADAGRLAALLLAETTTLGVRRRLTRRMTVERGCTPVETRYGVIRVKTGGGDSANAAPEYEDCREAARRAGVPLKRVHQEALRIFLNARAQE